MNQLKSILYISQRGYRGTRQSKPHIKSSKTVKPFRHSDFRRRSEKELYPEFDEFDFEGDANDKDLNADELDLSTSHKSYDEHQRELRRNKELLKLRMVAQKYFKSTDPPFITWTEREEMKNLYDKDKTEWTLDRLSEAFPALPQTIKKLLESPYKPKSVEAVLNYDKKVLENWKQFKAGNLALSPRLESHLAKFKDRNVKMADLETIADKFVYQKPVFPPPKSTLFTNIVKGYIEQKENEEKPKLQIQDRTVERNTECNEVVSRDLFDRPKRDTRYATFDTYLERKISKIVDKQNLTLEEQLLVEEYKKKVNQSAVERSKEHSLEKGKSAKSKKSPDAMILSSNSTTPVTNVMAPSTTSSLAANVTRSSVDVVTSSDTMVRSTDVTTSALIASASSAAITEAPPKPPEPEIVEIPRSKIEAIHHSSETGIIEWKKKLSNAPDDYPDFIRIPKEKAYTGITFKVADCYYDCDGEFLYRVPGLDLKSET